MELEGSVLTAPLPGGSSGATATVRMWITGEMGAPRGFLHKEDQPLAKARAIGRGAAKKIETWVPCPVFLLDHSSAGKILIDTGMPPAVAHDTKAALGRLGASMYAVRAEQSQPLPARLREAGIETGDLAAVVMTHLHFDHTGAMAEITGNTPVVVSDIEWKSAHGSRQLARGYMSRFYDLAHDFRLVDFDQSSVNSFASFGRSFDLFGDGSVMLVSTPGHTAGHMSIVVRTPTREVLLCGDAIYDRRSLEKSSAPLVLQDEHNYKRSVREIRQYQQMTPSALVVPGHDTEMLPPLDDQLI
jgi:N-acyl homoserine lactone hydrolase